MKTFDDILSCMADDKNIRTVSIELKRMSGGLRMTYETRVGEETKMGIEFVNAKDFESNKTLLHEVSDSMLDKIEMICKEKKTS